MELRITNKLLKNFSGTVKVIWSGDNDLYRTKDNYSYLAIYNSKWWRKMPAQLKTGSIAIKVDKDNTITMPDRLKESAGIKERVIIMPFIESHIEIWSEKEFWRLEKNAWRPKDTQSCTNKQLTELRKLVKSDYQNFIEANLKLSETKKRRIFSFIRNISVIKICFR